ncbi:MAG TPA: sn-glycerol-3-phosphate ABC transporter ATP-binding protein UgpC [Conexibacter sp.]|nr:sn-glycerol-3-phosphate ABC transporter ATP-binding protein UgpC [Conexibacter sp.]
MAEIAFEGVYKRYPDGTEAVRDLDLTVADGELMILVGPSGCGKSTALRMVAGLEQISDGQVRIGGRVVNRLAPKQRDLAMVFQNYALYPHMTVAENMGFALKMARRPKAEIAQKASAAAAVLDLADHLERKPANLSGGQRQRVAMGRAIVREPAAFLMDEPLSNLDAKLRVQMRAEVARIQQRFDTTTIYVTHDQVEAMTLGDRVAVMRHGVLQQVDTPQALYHRPDNMFVAGFIGSPAMTFVQGRLEGEELVLPFVRLPLDGARRAQVAAAGGAPVVGLRPHAFAEAAAVTPAARERGVLFTAPVGVVESLGSESYAYIAVEGRVDPELLRRHAGGAPISTPGEELLLNVRLDAETRLRVGDRAELWLDRGAVHLFDPRDGSRIVGDTTTEEQR